MEKYSTELNLTRMVNNAKSVSLTIDELTKTIIKFNNIGTTNREYNHIESVSLNFIFFCIHHYQCNYYREPRFIKLSLLSKESLKDEATKHLLNTPHDFVTVMGLHIRWSTDLNPNQIVISHFDFTKAE